MIWQTRTHWLSGLLWPGRGFVALALLGVAGFFTRNAGLILAGFLALVAAGIGISITSVLWHNFSLSVLLEERAIREQRGFTVTSERYINLEMIGSVVMVRRPLGRLLDYGDLAIVSLGGPYEWKNLGNFHILRRIVESRGEWLPDPPNETNRTQHERFQPRGQLLPRQ